MSHGLIDYRLSKIDLTSFCRNIKKYSVPKKIKNTTPVEKTKQKKFKNYFSSENVRKKC